MSADIANTTLASAPYFDDFNEDKKFHRVLFRPSFPVQARELTQLQSILQNQIERFGDSVYKTGSIIKGCAPTVIPDANYFVVPNAFDVSNTSYENAIAYGATTGIQARILKGISGFVDSTSPPKFVVKYTTVGANGATQFLENEVIDITMLANLTLVNTSLPLLQIQDSSQILLIVEFAVRHLMQEVLFHHMLPILL